MSEQPKIPLEILRGRRAHLDDLSLKDGSMEFAYDTGGLYFDVRNDSNQLERVQVSTNRLVKTTNNQGTLIINELDYDQVANKLDRVTPKDPESGVSGNVIIGGIDGTLVDSGIKLNDVGMGASVIFSEVVLESDKWINSTQSQVVVVPNVLATSTVIVSPKEPEISIRSNIYCSAQQDGQLTFKYISAKPKQDVVFYVVINGDIPEDSDFTRETTTVYLNPDNWTGTKNTQRVYANIKLSSVVTVSPVNVEQALPYNIYAVDQGNGYVDFTYGIKPEETIPFYLLIETYS